MASKSTVQCTVLLHFIEIFYEIVTILIVLNQGHHKMSIKNKRKITVGHPTTLLFFKWDMKI